MCACAQVLKDVCMFLGAVRCTTGATPPPAVKRWSTTSPTLSPTSGLATVEHRTAVSILYNKETLTRHFRSKLVTHNTQPGLVIYV